MSSSSASSTFRIDWRASRVLVAGLGLLGALAGISLLMSDLPIVAAVGLSLLALAWAARLALHETRRRPGVLVVEGRGDQARWLTDTRSVHLHGIRWHLRGPLAMMQAKDSRGRIVRFHWWPDTLPPTTRRQLRLARDLSSRYDNPLPSVAA